MRMIHYDSPVELAALLNSSGLGMSKKFGQNFLISPGARDKIITNLMQGYENPPADVWEIGPGLGAMTHMLLTREDVASVTVFEIDHGFCRVIGELFGEHAKFRLVEGDFLKTWKGHVKETCTPDLLLGNLPYNAGSVMIASLIESRLLPKKMVFTLQKEVVQRIVANPGSKLYSSFTILCSMDYECSSIGDLGPGNFYPRPDVVSSIVTFKRKESSDIPDSLRVLFMQCVRDLFATRRKTVSNNLNRGRLGNVLGKNRIVDALHDSGINPGERGENLSPTDILGLVKSLKKELDACD